MRTHTPSRLLAGPRSQRSFTVGSPSRVRWARRASAGPRLTCCLVSALVLAGCRDSLAPSEPRPATPQSGLVFDVQIGEKQVTKDSDVYKELIKELIAALGANAAADAAQVLDHMIADKHKWKFAKAAALKWEVTFRVRLIQAARDLASKKHGFGKGAEAGAKVQSWQNFMVTTVNGTSPGLKVKSKEKPSDAVAEIFGGKPTTRKYFFNFDCANAQTVAYYRALLVLLGAAEYDRLANNGNVFREIGFHIWAGQYENLTDSDLIPGDGFSFDNPDAEDACALNENTMYLGRNPMGDRMFFAHPYGVKSESELKALLDALRKPGAKREAQPREHQYHRWPVPPVRPDRR